MDRWPAGVGREIVRRARQHQCRGAAAGPRRAATGPLWILARRQTAARGRRGRAWVSPEGNFAASLLARPSGVLALRSFVAALGLFDALVAATGRPELFALKWPNDVLLTGGKLAGILLETGPRDDAGHRHRGEPRAARRSRWRSRPGQCGRSACATRRGSRWRRRSCSTCSRRPSPPGKRGSSRRDSRRSGRPGSPAPRGSGEEITARLPDRSVSGRFETVDAAARWCSATAEGRMALPAAEVHFGAEGAGHAACH